MWNKTSDRIENVEIERLASNEIDQSDTQRRSQQNLVIFVFNNHLFSCFFCATFMIFGNARHSTYCLDVEMSLELLLDPRKLQQVRTVPLSANYFVSSPSSIIHIIQQMWNFCLFTWTVAWAQLNLSITLNEGAWHYWPV